METPSSYDQANLRSIFFADYDGTETGFPSVWQQSVQLCERDQQTEPIAKAESEAEESIRVPRECRRGERGQATLPLHQGVGLTSIKSTTKVSVAPPGIMGGAPRSP